MKRSASMRKRPRYRRRGSGYILVLAVSTIVMIIGVSSILAIRVQRKTSQRAGDFAEASQHARAAIEMGFHMIRTYPDTWRAMFSSGTMPTNQVFGQGTFTLQAIDPIDGNLSNDPADPVVLIGIGVQNNARHRMQVTVNPVGDGYEFEPGSWIQVVQ